MLSSPKHGFLHDSVDQSNGSEELFAWTPFKGWKSEWMRRLDLCVLVEGWFQLCYDRLLLNSFQPWIFDNIPPPTGLTLNRLCVCGWFTERFLVEQLLKSLKTGTGDCLVSWGYFYPLTGCFKGSFRTVFHNFNSEIYFICKILPYKKHEIILIYGEILLFLQNECEFLEGKDSFCLFLLYVRSSAHRVSVFLIC